MLPIEISFNKLGLKGWFGKLSMAITLQYLLMDKQVLENLILWRDTNIKSMKKESTNLLLSKASRKIISELFSGAANT